MYGKEQRKQHKRNWQTSISKDKEKETIQAREEKAIQKIKFYIKINKQAKKRQ